MQLGRVSPSYGLKRQTSDYILANADFIAFDFIGVRPRSFVWSYVNPHCPRLIVDDQQPAIPRPAGRRINRGGSPAGTSRSPNFNGTDVISIVAGFAPVRHTFKAHTEPGSQHHLYARAYAECCSGYRSSHPQRSRWPSHPRSHKKALFGAGVFNRHSPVPAPLVR